MKAIQSAEFLTKAIEDLDGATAQVQGAASIKH
jgi:hypothetical protein